MFRSKDGLVRIEQVSNFSDAVFLPASWSVINIPNNTEQAESLFKNLYNTPTTRHVTLVLNRNRKKDKLHAISNIILAQKQGWSYLDTVSIMYEKGITSSSSLSSVSEIGYILYKGEPPELKNTAWFAENGNASNLWNLSAQAEEPLKATTYQKFSWEIQLLLLSLSKPNEYSKFIYGLPASDSELVSIFQFVNTYQVSVLLYVPDISSAELILSNYNKFLKEKEPK
jgi:hypothetical protein